MSVCVIVSGTYDYFLWMARFMIGRMAQPSTERCTMSTVAILQKNLHWIDELTVGLSRLRIDVTHVRDGLELRTSGADIGLAEASLFHHEYSGDECRPPLILVAEEGDYEAALLALKLRVTDFWTTTIPIPTAIERIDTLLLQTLPSPHYLARRIDRYLSQNHSTTSIDSTSVAREFGISPGYVSRLMNLAPWKGFGKRLLHHRIRHAEHLLTHTDEPLSLVSEECGFKSPARFSEAFSRAVGVPPKRCRSGARSIAPRRGK